MTCATQCSRQFRVPHVKTTRGQIIEMVRNYSILCDTHHPSYMKARLKDTIWDKIAKTLNLKSVSVLVSVHVVTCRDIKLTIH